MKIDVSEIKTFSTCARQWQLSSRNRFHLRPLVTPKAFALGTIFHEALAQLYLGVDYEKVMDMIRREMTEDDAALLAMIPGYYKQVLPEDLDRFKVLDVEHHFEYAPRTSDGEYLFPLEHKKDPKTGELMYDAAGEPIMESSLLVCGSIDMIVLDKETNQIYGFEHKTCKAFRDDTYIWMDEQPRVYTWALQQYVDEYNKRTYKAWLNSIAQYEQEHPGESCPWVHDYPVVATLGGVYLNEVKKLLRQFQYKRTLCTYSPEDLANFMSSFFIKCKACSHAASDNMEMSPHPTYMGCSMCTYKTICSTYMYEHLDKQAILNEFSEEFAERTEDHLDEKVERSVD